MGVGAIRGDAAAHRRRGDGADAWTQGQPRSGVHALCRSDGPDGFAPGQSCLAHWAVQAASYGSIQAICQHGPTRSVPTGTRLSARTVGLPPPSPQPPSAVSRACVSTAADIGAPQECQAYIDLKFGHAGDDLDDAGESSHAQASQSDLDERMKGMAQAYAFILMKEGHNYQQIHNEKIFFEALYDFTVRVTNQRFGPRVW